VHRGGVIEGDEPPFGCPRRVTNPQDEAARPSS